MLYYYVVNIKHSLPVYRDFLLDCLVEAYWHGSRLSNCFVVLHSLLPDVIFVLAASV